MSSQNKKLAIAITCSDWRLHQDGVHYNKQLTELLAGAHNSVSIALVARYQCAGNPASDEQHDADAKAAAEALRKAMDFAGPIVAVSTVYHDDAHWSLKEIARV